MANAVKPIPDGQSVITPYLTIKGAGDAISFYENAFGATEVCRLVCPQSGKILHAELRIGNACVFLSEEWPDCGGVSPLALGGSPVGIHLYVEDTDAAFARAVEAGATPEMPPADMFWGDRFAKLVDPFGHKWSLAHQIEALTPDQMQERMIAEFASAPASA